jgi:type VI secretion system ImpM family protein
MSSVGWYGKVPCMGDFLNKHVDVQFSQPWDHWLQTGITSLRTKFNGHADEVLLTFPIWRFFVRAGTFDHHHWAGVFAPSADRVNRIFPFTVVTRIEERSIEAISSNSLQIWLDSAQAAVENLLADDDLSGFELALQQLPSLQANGFTSFEDRFASQGFIQKLKSADFSILWWTQLSVVHEASLIDPTPSDVTQRLSPNAALDISNAMAHPGRFEFCEWNGPLHESLFERLMAL